MLTGLDALTAGLSHELVEAATDPLLTASPGWAYTDTEHLIWSFQPGAEVADMCEMEVQSFQRLVGPYIVQRPWSNASARAGHDPCVPPLGQPYFVAAPVFKDVVNIAFNFMYVESKGVIVPMGKSRTIPVQLFSDGPVPDWTVKAVDLATPPGLTFQWDKDTGNSGDTLNLTITRTDPSAGEFAIESYNATITNLWFGFAGQ